MRQSFSNDPRRTPKQTLRLAPLITYAEWTRRQSITNQLARKG